MIMQVGISKMYFTTWQFSRCIMIGRSAAICYNCLMMNTNTMIPYGRLLQSKPHHQTSAGFHAGPLSWTNCNLECWFVEGGKPLSAETNNKLKLLNPHIWHRAGIEPGHHWWEASALSTEPSLLPWNWKLCVFRHFQIGHIRILGVGLDLACTGG